MHHDSPPGPDFDLETMSAVAKTAARRWPGLAPRGGHRWTTEDIDRGVSILFEVSRKRAFLDAFPRGKVGRRCRGYLLAALHHELIDLRTRSRKLLLLDSPSLDSIPRAAVNASRLDAEDLRGFAQRLLARMPERVAAELSRRLSDERSRALAGSSRRGGSSSSSRKRRWAAALDLIEAFSVEQGLNRDECDQVLTVVERSLAERAGRTENPDEEC